MSSTLAYEGDNAPVEVSDSYVPLDLSDDPHTQLFAAVKSLGDILAEDQPLSVRAAIRVSGGGVAPRDMDFCQLLHLYGSLRLIGGE
jgi:hypothetical protein